VCIASLFTITVIDIYNSTAGTWQIALMQEPREGLAAASENGIVMFAGGIADGNYSSGTTQFRELCEARDSFANTIAVVEIYFNGSFSWKTLSIARGCLAGATANGRIMFGGGKSDVYHRGNCHHGLIPTHSS
jgi:hypothetical protein